MRQYIVIIYTPIHTPTHDTHADTPTHLQIRQQPRVPGLEPPHLLLLPFAGRLWRLLLRLRNGPLRAHEAAHQLARLEEPDLICEMMDGWMYGYRQGGWGWGGWGGHKGSMMGIVGGSSVKIVSSMRKSRVDPPRPRLDQTSKHIASHPQSYLPNTHLSILDRVLPLHLPLLARRQPLLQL